MSLSFINLLYFTNDGLLKTIIEVFPVVITMLDINESETNTTYRMSELVCVCFT